ncbi:hypothetical protein BC937DRAFT_87109, partial [Endogone sp. FLAS-F59071]
MGLGGGCWYKSYPPDTIRDLWAKQLAAAQLAEEEVLARLLNPAVTPSAEEFSQAFFEHVQNVTREEDGMEESEIGDRVKEKREKEKGVSDMDVDTKGDESQLRGAKAKKKAKEIGEEKEEEEGEKKGKRKRERKEKEREKGKGKEKGKANGPGERESKGSSDEDEDEEGEGKTSELEDEENENERLKEMVKRVHEQCLRRRRDSESTRRAGGVAISTQPILELALKRLHDVPEPDLVFLLRHTRALCANAPENSSSMSFRRVLALVVSAPRNDLFMQQALYKLESEDLIATVETLTKWFEWWEERESVEFEGIKLEKTKGMEEVPAFKV